MRWTIAKRFRFEAAHSLPSLPVTHPCSRVHGHSYTVEVQFQSDTLDEHGFVRDYGDLTDLESWFARRLATRNLNEQLDCPTSAEHLAQHIYMVARGYYREVVAVRVSETETSWAEYRP